MYYLCNVNQGARQSLHNKGSKYPSHNQVKSSIMKQKETAKAFFETNKVLKESKESLAKVREIVIEAHELAIGLRKSVDEGEERINIVDALNIDLYYEYILSTRFHLENVSRILKSLVKNGKEEDFSFASEHIKALTIEAGLRRDKIKELISKLD